MSYRCGKCGEYGHNKRTCPGTTPISKEVKEEEPEERETTEFRVGMPIFVQFPWENKKTKGTITSSPDNKGNFFFSDGQRSHGLNLNSNERYGYEITKK